MAVIIDIGEANDIHPKNKQDVGKRLALWALAKTHGKAIAYSGPLYKSMRVRGDKIILRFDHVNGGLVAGGGEPLRGFAIAGEDRKFIWADAEIDGDTVVVRSDKVSKPVAVRYAWANNPVCNLYNGAGLPASPFRTDDWPGITRGGGGGWWSQNVSSESVRADKLRPSRLKPKWSLMTSRSTSAPLRSRTTDARRSMSSTASAFASASRMCTAAPDGRPSVDRQVAYGVLMNNVSTSGLTAAVQGSSSWVLKAIGSIATTSAASRRATAVVKDTES